MKKSIKRALSLALSLLMLLGILSGCGGTPTASDNSGETMPEGYDPLIHNEETIELVVFSQLANWSGAQEGWGATLLKDMFNIELTIIPDADGAYATRMESGDLGDIIAWGSNGDQYQDAVNKGMLFAWEDEDLLATYGQNILEYFPEALEANRELNSDGQIYGIGHGIAGESNEHDLFFYDWGIRWDLYEQLGHPEINNLDDLVELFKQMKEICPTGDDGNPAYAASLWPDWDGTMVMNVKSLASAYYGYDEFGIGLYDSATGEFHGALEADGPYMEALKFYNQLYRNDLLDPDSMTQTFDTMSSKVRNGNVFFSVFDYAGSLLFNSEEHLAQNKLMASLVPNEANTIVYGLNTTGNERIWSIGSKCIYPEKAMQLIDWLCTPEGGMTIWYGIKGLMWDYDENGNTYFTELGKKCANDSSTDLSGVEWTSPYTGETYTLSGTFNDGLIQINNTTWSSGATNPDSNGEKFNKVTWASEQGDARNEAEQDWRDFTGATTVQEYLDSTDYAMVPTVSFALATRSADLDLKWEQVCKAIKEGSWRAMYAEDDAAFEAEVQSMIEACNGYGYEECVQWCEDEAARKFALQ